MSVDFNAAFKQKNTLIPYITYGDPSPEFTEELCDDVFKSGADIIELGLPFSDPIADGPVIQLSHQRALLNKDKVTIEKAFEMVQRLKQKHNKPIIFMGSVNLIMQYGMDNFFKNAIDHDLDGVVIPDLSIEAAEPYIKSAQRVKLPIIFLVSPLCGDERLKKIVAASSGFIYLISNTGITGERDHIPTNLDLIIQKIKVLKDIPVAIGFGISTPEHVKTVNNVADGAIVGSHLVKIITENLTNLTQAKTKFSKRVTALKSI